MNIHPRHRTTKLQPKPPATLRKLPQHNGAGRATPEAMCAVSALDCCERRRCLGPIATLRLPAGGGGGGFRNVTGGLGANFVALQFG